MPEDNPVVVRHIYPANVVIPTGLAESTEHRGALAIVTQHRLNVWIALGGGPSLVFDEEYLEPDRPLPHVAQLRSVPLVLGFDGGDGVGQYGVQVTAGSGCGCGSPLKSFRPFAVDVTGPTR